MALDKGPRVASASWPAYGDVQPFTGEAKLGGYHVTQLLFVWYRAETASFSKNLSGFAADTVIRYNGMTDFLGVTA